MCIIINMWKWLMILLMCKIMIMINDINIINDIINNNIINDDNDEVLILILLIIMY